MQYFEYKRGLPHAWYCHLTFWPLSFVSQTSIFTVLLAERGRLLADPDDELSKVQAYTTVGLLAFLSLCLTLLGFCYRKEFRHNQNRGRNYLPHGSRNISAGPLLESQERPLSGRSLFTKSEAGRLSDSQGLRSLPQLLANIKNIFYDSEQVLTCEIYAYKDGTLHRKLKRPFEKLLELEDLILLKYQKRFIDRGLLQLSALPSEDKLNLRDIKSKEAFKRSIDVFFACLLSDRSSATDKFNYVCREVLEFLEYGGPSAEAAIGLSWEKVGLEDLGTGSGVPRSAERADFVEDYMKQMEIKATRYNFKSGDALIPGDSEDIVARSGNKKADLQDYLTKLLKKEQFYRVKVDYLQQTEFRGENMRTGGVLINITINRVIVFHKTLKEIEEFFIALAKRIDDNPIISGLIKEILSRESIKMSNDNSVTSHDERARPKRKHAESAALDSGNLEMVRDLDLLSHQITDALYLILNDPYYHCKTIYRFLNSHQLFQIMPIVQRFRSINLIKCPSSALEFQAEGRDARRSEVSHSSESLSRSVSELHQQRNPMLLTAEAEAEVQRASPQHLSSTLENKSLLKLSKEAAKEEVMSPHLQTNSNSMAFAGVDPQERVLVLDRDQSPLEFINFKAECHLVDTQFKVIDDQPQTVYTLKIVKSYQLSTDGAPQSEAHEVRLVGRTLQTFHQQLLEYFDNLDCKTLLPRPGLDAMTDFDNVSDNTPNSYLVLSQGLTEGNEATTGQDAAILRYVNRLLSNERLLFCPLIRSFLHFDSSTKSRIRSLESEMIQTLHCRRAHSFWKQDTRCLDEANEGDRVGLLGLKNSFYFGDLAEQMEPDIFEEQMQPFDAPTTKLNYELLLQSDHFSAPPTKRRHLRDQAESPEAGSPTRAGQQPPELDDG